MSELSLSNVTYLTKNAYLPFANIERAIFWPDQPERLENDAEHSFSLALIGLSLGAQLGYDPAKIALYATVHDFPELFADDTSLWDSEGRKTKHARETVAIEEIAEVFDQTPALHTSIVQYESLADPEARFVYALDKLVAHVVLVEGNGAFWKAHGISYEMHAEKAKETKEKIAVCPEVLVWFEELLQEISEQRHLLFDE